MEPSHVMHGLPEHLFQDYASHYDFMLNNSKMGLIEYPDYQVSQVSLQLVAIFECFVLLMRSQEAVTNPFVRIAFLNPIYAICR